MFEINHIISRAYTGNIIQERTHFESNKITILTGENGSGKSEILAGLVDHYENGGSNSIKKVSPGKIRPTKIIAQTFSPFSKFPQPPHEISRYKDSKDLFSEESNRRNYEVIGFHKRSSFQSTSITKSIIESSLIKLAASPENKSAALAKTLNYLGHNETVLLRYRSQGGIRLMEYSNSDEGFRKRIADDLDKLKTKPPSNSKKWLAQELQNRGRDELIETLYEALRSIPGKTNENLIEIEIDLSNRISEKEIKTIESIILLRKFGYFSLHECYLSGKDARPDGNVGQLSSGQQQIISSIFGLATAIEDNSLVLIDEPELSLHPQWQSDWLTLLEGVIKNHDGCHIIIATHSPLLVAAANSLNHSIITIGDKPEDLNKWELSSKASIDEALIKVFHIATPNSEYLANELIASAAKIDATAAEKELALSSLERLLEVYKNKNPTLIKKAISLLSQ